MPTQETVAATISLKCESITKRRNPYAYARDDHPFEYVYSMKLAGERPELRVYTSKGDGKEIEIGSVCDDVFVIGQTYHVACIGPDRAQLQRDADIDAEVMPAPI